MTHKRECSRCVHNGRNSVECLKCPGPAEKSYKGVNFVWLDTQPDPDGFVDKRIDVQKGVTDQSPVERQEIMTDRRAIRARLDSILRQIRDVPQRPEEFRQNTVNRLAYEIEEVFEDLSNLDSGTTRLPPDLQSALVPVISQLFRWSPRELLVIYYKFKGEEDAEVAGHLGVSKQRVNAIVNSLCKKSPVICSTINAMRRTGAGGARREYHFHSRQGKHQK